MTTASETTSPVIVSSNSTPARPAPIPAILTDTPTSSPVRLARLRANPVLRNGSPWFASFLFHGVLLLVVGFLLWKLGKAPPAPPQAPVVSFADPSIGHTDKNREPLRASSGSTAQSKSQAARSESTVDAAADTSMSQPEMGVAGTFKSRPIRGLSTASPLTSVSAGLAMGLGVGPRNRPVSSSTATNDTSDANKPVASGTRVTFAGLGASGARSVVYVVDASGPMVSSLREVVAEIERSVARLSPSQRFGVVVFHDSGQGSAEGGEQTAGRQTETFMPILVRATPDARLRLGAWLAGIEPKGKSNPLDGLRAGLALKPEAVFLLSKSIERTSGGEWQLGLDATMRELDRLNPLDPTGKYRSVSIKTIQFMDEDTTGIMQAIGLRHGGTGGDAGYRVVRDGKDLE